MVRPVQVGLNELEGLLALGVDVSVHDSWVGAHQVDATTERTELTSEALSGSDTVVIVTDHDDVDYELIATHVRYVFDTRHRMPIGTAEAL